MSLELWQEADTTDYWRVTQFLPHNFSQRFVNTVILKQKEKNWIFPVFRWIGLDKVEVREATGNSVEVNHFDKCPKPYYHKMR